ncbi:protein-glutamine gamma-glutamyltransferase 6-like [Amia ocellicauda]|uniref:protein-glutamine gamma-glutamyltransferase 6-like n=1 Tax=Amia ocellicauda TaxID=2972642 RepID=UPI0034649D05
MASSHFTETSNRRSVCVCSGSAKERQVYELAVKEICGSSTVPKLEPRPQKPLAVELKFVQRSKPINGQDIAFSLSVCSNSPTVHSLKVTITAHSIWYNGLALAELLRKEEDVKLQPNTEVTIPKMIPTSQYKWKTQDSTTITLQAVAVPSSGGDTFLEKKDIKLEDPTLTMIHCFSESEQQAVHEVPSDTLQSRQQEAGGRLQLKPVQEHQDLPRHHCQLTCDVRM